MTRFEAIGRMTSIPQRFTGGFERGATLEPGEGPPVPPKMTQSAYRVVAQNLWRLAKLAPDPSVTKKLQALHRQHQQAMAQIGAESRALFGPQPSDTSFSAATLASIKAGEAIPARESAEERRLQVEDRTRAVMLACKQLSLEACELARAEAARLTAAVGPKLAELEKFERIESDDLGLTHQRSPGLRLQHKVLADIADVIPRDNQLFGYGCHIKTLLPWLE